ncbi:cardiolipin synthase [Pseudozobellia thermophila]|uniref:Cardiolipin synthase n=1 Tax=Pseudozobellia thermophila TaxID=192903 RepID=A0A1M6INH8_9FLAO|nr:cardiolipin synthase [Pseudozobellia thermophila]SHJ35950.1 cardiolipin synthase [Pseudozobellia thermophila]
MWTTIFIVIYVVIALAIVVSLLLHGAKPSKTLSWLLAIFTIPVGGILLYLLLGRNRRKNKLIRIRDEALPKIPESSGILMAQAEERYRKLMRLVYKNSQFPPTDKNRLTLLKNGKSTFESIFGALESAKIQIHLQYYIFEDGELANRLLHLFERKIAEGVKVKMIYDGIGSFSLSKSYLKKLLEVGVEVYPFLPFRFGRFLSSLNYRNHRKIIVVDGKIAFTGGINISDKYLKGDPVLGKWHDMHLRIEGPAAAHLDHVFAMDWHLVCQKSIPPLTQPVIAMDNHSSGKLVQIVAGGPDDDFPSLEQTYFTIINGAKDYLYVTNPYVIPGQAIMQALQTCARSGIDVRLLVSENADNKIVNWSVRSYFETMLKAGIKIYLFPDGFLHSKIIVSDDAVSTIGTANLDDRSFEQNYEVNAVIYDRDFARLLKEDFLRDANISRMLSYQEYVDRPFMEKLKEGFGKVFSPLL